MVTETVELRADRIRHFGNGVFSYIAAPSLGGGLCRGQRHPERLRRFVSQKHGRASKRLARVHLLTDEVSAFVISRFRG